MRARKIDAVEFEYTRAWKPNLGEKALSQHLEWLDGVGYTCFWQGNRGALAQANGGCWKEEYHARISHRWSNLVCTAREDLKSLFRETSTNFVSERRKVIVPETTKSSLHFSSPHSTSFLDAHGHAAVHAATDLSAPTLRWSPSMNRARIAWNHLVKTTSRTLKTKQKTVHSITSSPWRRARPKAWRGAPGRVPPHPSPGRAASLQAQVPSHERDRGRAANARDRGDAYLRHRDGERRSPHQFTEMHTLDWFMHILLCILVGFVVHQELEQSQIAGMMVAQAFEDDAGKVSVGWSLLLFFILRVRQHILIPLTVATAPILAIEEGLNAMNVALNVMAILFIFDLDDGALTCLFSRTARLPRDGRDPHRRERAEPLRLARPRPHILLVHEHHPSDFALRSECHLLFERNGPKFAGFFSEGEPVKTNALEEPPRPLASWGCSSCSTGSCATARAWV